MSRAGRLVVLAILLSADRVSGQASTPVPPPGNQAIPEAFDVRAAVDAYLANMPPAQRAHSDAYFEGGYWLLLWDFLSTVVVMWLLLRFRWSARIRNLAERLTHYGLCRPHSTGFSSLSLFPWSRSLLASTRVTSVSTGMAF